MADTIQDIVERIESALDRFRNAGDNQGVLDAECAIGDLRSLRVSAIPAALEIEAYFNKRIAARAKKARSASGSTVDDDDDSYVDTDDDDDDDDKDDSDKDDSSDNS